MNFTSIDNHVTQILLFGIVISSITSFSFEKEGWFFLPNYNHDIRGLEKQFLATESIFKSFPKKQSLTNGKEERQEDTKKDAFRWQPAVFPHKAFVEMMPFKNVFGWYGCTFDLSNELSERDLVLDLGLIDDSDETFVNGSFVGATGQVPGKSAWQLDRLYRVPSSLLKREGNFCAVHVWNSWGLGGMVGPPVIKSAIAPSSSQWSVVFIQDSSFSGYSLNDVKSLKEVYDICFKEGIPDWRSFSLPWHAYGQWKADEHLALFKLSFPMLQANGVPIHFSSTAFLDIGAVFDVASVYLNNKFIGQVGVFPDKDEPAFTEAGHRGVFIVEPNDWSVNGQNQLVIVVYRERGIGGIPGVPGLLINNPLFFSKHSDISVHREAFDILVNSNRLNDAESLLLRAPVLSKSDDVWYHSSRAYLAFLTWLKSRKQDMRSVDLLLSSMSNILTKNEEYSPNQSAMQAFCRILRKAEIDTCIADHVRRFFPHFQKDVISLPIDTQTRGDWIPYRGVHSYVLSAMGQMHDWTGGFHRFNYERSIPGNLDKPRHRLAKDARYVSDSTALLIPSEFNKAMEKTNDFLANVPTGHDNYVPKKNVRRASWWDDHGEMHPFDDGGPDLEVTIRDTLDCLRFFSVYMMDYDWRRTTHPRQQSVLLWANGHFVDAQWLGKIDTGVYASWAIQGKKEDMRLRFVKHRGASVAVSGLFMDAFDGFMPCLPRSSYKNMDNAEHMDTVRMLSEQLVGSLDQETIQWYEKLRMSKGLERVMIARKYKQLKSKMLSQEASLLGLFVYAIAAEACGETFQAVGEWSHAIPIDRETQQWMPVLLENMSRSGTIRHSCWYLAAVKQVLGHLPNREMTSEEKKDLCENVCWLGLSCMVPGTMSVLHACLNEIKRLGMPEASQSLETLKNLIRNHSSKSGPKKKLGNWTPSHF